MSCIKVERLHPYRRSDAAGVHVLIQADALANRPAPWHQALAFALEADHNCVWPTHRIRGFLLTQQPLNLSLCKPC